MLVYPAIEVAYQNGWEMEAEFHLPSDRVLSGMIGAHGREDLVVVPAKGMPRDLGPDLMERLIESHCDHGLPPGTWLSIAEVEDVNNAYFKFTQGTVPAHWLALYGAMKGFQIGGKEPRLVFWFSE